MEPTARPPGHPPERPSGSTAGGPESGPQQLPGPSDAPPSNAPPPNTPDSEPDEGETDESSPQRDGETTRQGGATRGHGAAARLTAASRTTATAVSAASRGTVRRVRRVTQAQGMGESGLSRLIELHAFHMAGDAAMAIGLAGTLFFAATTSEARDQVALALLVTMAPFAIVAPLIGPFLDRFRRGRRWAIGSTMAIRAFLCWVLAGAVVADQWWLYPATLGCLVASKAYNVTRSSAVPRLIPGNVTLVTANSRISLSGSIGAGIGGAIAGGASWFGPEWALRVAFVIFIAGTILAILLPPRVDSSAGEEHPRRDATVPRMRGMPARVVVAIRCNAALRAYSGFLLLFLAFLLREQPIGDLSPGLLVAVVAGAAGLGAGLGTALGALIRARKPTVMVRIVLRLRGSHYRRDIAAG